MIVQNHIRIFRRLLGNSQLQLGLRFRHRMSSPVPISSSVRGMKELNNDLFKQHVTLPCLNIKCDKIGSVKKLLEKYSAKIRNIKPVQDSADDNCKQVLLNPQLVQVFEDIDEADRKGLQLLGVAKENFSTINLQFDHTNWTTHEKLKAVLPTDSEGVSGYSLIGHIIHLNLKEHLMPYKKVIGEILLETKNVKSVVTKIASIDNTYRNFAFELLAGEEDFEVTVKENGFSFTFDFSKVYWNPRLSTEHSRVIKELSVNDVLFDACCGVGPFSIPASKKCSEVFANDLNPVSYRYLLKNKERNRIADVRLKCFNLDAREFIRTVVKARLIEMWKSGGKTEVRRAHITMNLPALAITFLDVFQGLMADLVVDEMVVDPLPLVHVYTFSNTDNQLEDVKKRCEEYLGTQLDTDHLQGIHFVRNVAPNKDMFRAVVKIPQHLLFQTSCEENLKRSISESQDDSASKKHCVLEDE